MAGPAVVRWRPGPARRQQPVPLPRRGGGCPSAPAARSHPQRAAERQRGREHLWRQVRHRGPFFPLPPLLLRHHRFSPLLSPRSAESARPQSRGRPAPPPEQREALPAPRAEGGPPRPQSRGRPAPPPEQREARPAPRAEGGPPRLSGVAALLCLSPRMRERACGDKLRRAAGGALLGRVRQER